MDGIGNEEVRRRAGIERELASRAEEYSHDLSMWKEWMSMARRVLMTEVSGGRVRGRPRLGWMDV